jgi:hypothetical protein
MKYFKILFSLAIILLCVGCGITKKQQIGTAKPTNFEYKTAFKNFTQ